jgi:adenine-specific DNA-methyltransferase
MNKEILIKNKYKKINKNINYEKNIDTDFDIKVNGVNKKDNYVLTVKIDADIEDFFKNIEIINFIETMKEGHITSITKCEYINNLNEEHSGKYGLVWDAEKVPEQVVVDCNKLIPVLKEEENKKIDNGGEDNILIEGDNFHSLSVLNYTHKESIDVIYIDPPYNTGNKDFMYNDSFVDVEDGYRHSKWLNYMTKRLKLARNLLKDDGIICISIDDNEQSQLKLLCDKIFGENNYINTISIKSKSSAGASGGGEDKKLKKNIEYVLIYAKNYYYTEIKQFTSIKIYPFVPMYKEEGIRWKYIPF